MNDDLPATSCVNEFKNFECWILQAVEFSKNALTLSSPNPRVGCVLTNATGEVIGQGHTQRAGGPHAEVMALRDAAAKGNSTVGATAYVTLEPCSHHGRTGPCCDALIAAGIAKVVATNLDPNPLVAGQGFERLRQAGVEVQVLPPEHPAAVASRELNIGFFSRMVRKTPWVRMKVATSLDGKTALPDGRSQWITAEAARADGHAWRARACAILTGVGTILQDNPRLDVRLVDTPRQPHLVIVDSQLQTPVHAALFETLAERKVWIYAVETTDAHVLARAQALRARGADVRFLPPTSATSARVHLGALMTDLARHEVNELHVEAGQTLNGALVAAGLLDELLLYMAPKLIGAGLDAARFGPLPDLDAALMLEFKSLEQVGPDLRVLARVRGRDAF